MKIMGKLLALWLQVIFFQCGAKDVYGTSGDGYFGGTEELSAYNDIAHYLTYGEWHMPSQAQFEELVSPTNTTSAWVTIESTKGRLITSKVNGISLFFAAAGYSVTGLSKSAPTP